MGNVITGGEFEWTRSLNSPPRALLTAVSTIRATGLIDDPRYPEYLQGTIRRTNRTRRNFSRPPTQSDRLFRAIYNHPTSTSSYNKYPIE